MMRLKRNGNTEWSQKMILWRTDMKKDKNKLVLGILTLCILVVWTAGAVIGFNQEKQDLENEPSGTDATTQEQDKPDSGTPTKESSFIKGVDLSTIIALEDAQVVFKDKDDKEEDIFNILKDAGINYIRIRIWNNPYDEKGNSFGGGDCDLDNAKEIGIRATKAGMRVMVDFHYSDYWADPEKQYAPKEWENYTEEEKETAVYTFTYDSIKEILDAGVDVGLVQIGNETNGSMCGEGGLFGEEWDLSTGVGQMMKSGCKAIDDINGKYDREILKVLHFTDLVTNGEWYAKCVNQLGIDYDVFATSFYPMWHGDVKDMTKALSNIAKTYDKKVLVVETGYPYTYVNFDSVNNNIGDESGMVHKDYEVSQEGQSQAVHEVMMGIDKVNEAMLGYGLGTFYWEPAWISAKGFGSTWENIALFDKDGKAMESLYTFGGYENKE